MQRKFTVVGRGEFPYIMLFQDRCYAADPASAEAMGVGHTVQRVVHLIGATCTAELWEKNGWSVTERIEDGR